MIRNSQAMNFQNLHVQEILRGSDYEGYDKKRALDADVFRDIDKLIKARSSSSGSSAGTGSFSVSTELSLENTIKKSSVSANVFPQQQKIANVPDREIPAGEISKTKTKGESIFEMNPLF